MTVRLNNCGFHFRTFLYCLQAVWAQGMVSLWVSLQHPAWLCGTVPGLAQRCKPDQTLSQVNQRSSSACSSHPALCHSLSLAASRAPARAKVSGIGPG